MIHKPLSVRLKRIPPDAVEVQVPLGDNDDAVEDLVVPATSSPTASASSDDLIDIVVVDDASTRILRPHHLDLHGTYLLYDKSHPDFKNKIAKQNASQTIADMLERTDTVAEELVEEPPAKQTRVEQKKGSTSKTSTLRAATRTPKKKNTIGIEQYLQQALASFTASLDRQKEVNNMDKDMLMMHTVALFLKEMSKDVRRKKQQQIFDE
ncbi:hypothetical protein FQR65_LT18715 [Abscondita terminalis]|nr:hypothetical protein FQR65_LT18715 [Abscondita terminalis]